MCFECGILSRICIHTADITTFCFHLYFIFWLCWVLVAVWAFSSCREWRLLFPVVHMLLIAMASLSLSLFFLWHVFYFHFF